MPDRATAEEILRTVFGYQAFRGRLAEAQNVPPYIVFNDLTLAGIVARRPLDEGALMAVSGIGEAKLERYGRAILAVVREHREREVG